MLEKIKKELDKLTTKRTKTIDKPEFSNYQKWLGNNLLSYERGNPRIEVVKEYATTDKGQTYIKSKNTIEHETIRITYIERTKIEYGELVTKLVRKFYTADEETAILRKSIANGIGEEFETYNTLVELVKSEVKKALG